MIKFSGVIIEIIDLNNETRFQADSLLVRTGKKDMSIEFITKLENFLINELDAVNIKITE